MKLLYSRCQPQRAATVFVSVMLGALPGVGPSPLAFAQTANGQSPTTNAGTLTTSAAFISGTLTTPAAFDQTQALSTAQIAATTTAVRNALANLNPSLAGAARTQAVNQALSQVAASEIAADGPAAIVPIISAAVAAGIPAPQAIGPVLPAAINNGVPPAAAVDAIAQVSISVGGSPTQTTQAIVAAAAQAGVSGTAIGTGLGQAVVALRQSVNAGNQVSQAVASQAAAGIGQNFNTAVASNGFPQLANGGQGDPNPVTGTPTAAFGQPQSLSAVEIGTIQAQVGAAIAAVDPALTGAARTQAINQALSQ